MGGNRNVKESMEDTVKRVLKDVLQDASILQVLATMIKDHILSELQKTIDENTAVIEALKETINEKDAVINDLQVKLDDLEQYQRRQCLRVFGVEEGPDEDTDVKAIEIARKIGVDLSIEDIDRSHRIGVRNNDRPRPIIIKFVSYRKRSEVFHSKKNLKGSGVTIREDLTKMRHSLLKEAINKYGVRSVWTLDGVVIAKIGDQKRRITSSRDLCQ